MLDLFSAKVFAPKLKFVTTCNAVASLDADRGVDSEAWKYPNDYGLVIAPSDGTILVFLPFKGRAKMARFITAGVLVVLSACSGSKSAGNKYGSEAGKSPVPTAEPRPNDGREPLPSPNPTSTGGINPPRPTPTPVNPSQPTAPSATTLEFKGTVEGGKAFSKVYKFPLKQVIEITLVHEDLTTSAECQKDLLPGLRYGFKFRDEDRGLSPYEIVRDEAVLTRDSAAINIFGEDGELAINLALANKGTRSCTFNGKFQMIVVSGEPRVTPSEAPPPDTTQLP